jgi:hypothetical protein
MAMQYQHYMRMSKKRMAEALAKRDLPALMVEHIMDVVEKQREARRVERLKTKMHKNLWGNLLTPLQRELKLIRAAQFYDSGDGGQRGAALAAYETALLRARAVMQRGQKQKLTPKQAAKDCGVPNNGLHWVDWVPEESQAKVNRLFAAIPHKNKAKHKHPFSRGAGVTGQAKALRLQIAQCQARIARLEQEAVIQETAGDSATKARDKITDLNRRIISMTHQLQEAEHESRSKEQRDAKKQAAIQDATAGADTTAPSAGGSTGN